MRHFPCPAPCRFVVLVSALAAAAAMMPPPTAVAEPPSSSGPRPDTTPQPAPSPKPAPNPKAREIPKLPPQTPLIPLWPDQQVPLANGIAEDDAPTLGYFPAPPQTANGAAVVICPGGGYGFLAMDHEGTQVAHWLNSLGISAYVLRYRLAPKYRHPAMMLDVQRALRTVRAKAADHKLHAERIGVLGFSAGGHLASTAATHFDTGLADAPDPIERFSCRPDFAILVYPVITLKPPHHHGGSARNLLGTNPDPQLVDRLSNHLQVSAKTPPTLLVHSRDDRGVPFQNSELFAEACQRHNVPCQVLLYNEGGHGYGLGRPNTDSAAWPAEAAKWLASRGVLPTPVQ